MRGRTRLAGVGLRVVLAVGAVLSVGAVLTAGATAATADDVAGWRSVHLDVGHTDVAGTTIAWAQLGSGRPLVLLNGTASPMNEWDPALLAGLAARHRVIVLDYPGLGDSGPAPGRWTFDGASDWVAALLAQVAPDGADVLGWSMGGFVAQRLAIRHPEAVRSLVLAATNPGGGQAVLGPTWVQRIDSASSSDADYLRTNYPARGRDAGRGFLSRLEWAVDSGAYPETDVPEATLRAMVAAEDPWLGSDTNLAELGRVAVPTLVITGREDLVTPAVNSRRLADRIPGARLVLVPGAGHSFLFQQPAATSALISRFLDDAGSRGGGR